MLKNLQEIVSGVPGSTIYRIDGLSLLGEPNEDTTIEVVRREGTSASLASRVERDPLLKGTKKIIVREGNVHIGKGRKDGRSLLVIPVISSSPFTPNRIEFLLLLEIAFKENIPLPAKIKALGGRYERIKNIVQESCETWEDTHLELVEISDLFGLSAEKTGDQIVSRLN